MGVVEIRGDNVISDYFDNPEATESSFNGEWFSTGDMGFMDAEGDLCIVGRSKEIIIVRGQNYYPPTSSTSPCPAWKRRSGSW